MGKTIIKPQPGFQTNFLSSAADIVIGGSAAGVGKTFALLMEGLRNINNPDFNALIFRRTSPQIRLPGGLWDTSMQIYPNLNASPKETLLKWDFPSGANLKFSHLQYEKDKLEYQGSQIAFIGFDELTHFSETMFFYLLSRNRSTCGVKPYLRATCNPDPESWVAKFIGWWIDQDTGYPIPERDGVLRYFIRTGENYIWGDSKQEVLDKARYITDEMLEKANKAAKEQGKENTMKAEDFVKSLTFISGSIYQNQELLKVDPSYLANLLSQDEATRRSLLESNWQYVKNNLDIYSFESFKGMFDNIYDVKDPKKKSIVADIAGKGKDKFVVSYFEGRSFEDITIMNTSTGPDVVNAIKAMARKHKVPNRKILIDADGIGALVDGFIPGSIPFHGNSRPKKVVDKLTGKFIDEEYKNLKTQLVYRSGQAINSDKYVVSDKVANTRYDDKMSIRERMIFERKAFKKHKINIEGKKQIIPKEEMKIILQGQSPDIIDTLFMNELFFITKEPQVFQTTQENLKGLNY